MKQVFAWGLHDGEVRECLKRYVRLHGLLHYFFFSVAVLLIIGLALIGRFFLELLCADGTLFIGIFMFHPYFMEIVEVIRDELLRDDESGAEVVLH